MTTAELVVAAVKPQLMDFVSKSKVSFISRFGGWVADAHVGELESIFLACGVARIEMWAASTPELVEDWREVYATALLRLETIGLEDFTIGKITAKQFIRDEITQILSYIPMVAGIVVKTALPFALPGIGSVLAPPLGAGIEYFLDKVMGVK